MNGVLSHLTFEALILGAMPLSIYLVDSRTTDGVQYRVVVENGRLSCDCTGFEIKKRCWHIAHVRELMESSKNAIGNLMWDERSGLKLNIWVDPTTVTMTEAGEYGFPDVDIMLAAYKHAEEELKAIAPSAPVPAANSAQGQGNAPSCPVHNAPMRFFAGKPGHQQEFMRYDKFKCTKVVVPSSQSDSGKPVYCNKEERA